MRAVIAGRGPCREIASDLRAEGVEVLAIVPRAAPAEAALRAGGDAVAAELLDVLAAADLLLVDAAPDSLTAPLVSLCDRLGVRIVARCAREVDRRLAASFGLSAVAAKASARQIVDPLALAADPALPAGHARGRIIAVWGPAGAPGRSTVAASLALELSRSGRRVALVDGDSHAPSIALAAGLPDEGPGFAAACRQAERGVLTSAELARISVPLHDVAVLTGINRPSRWPELTESRVRRALDACRDWVDVTVVDVAAPLERDEEIVSDLDGLRRNAATRAALAEADIVVAVVGADPVGVSRFIRDHADLREAAGPAPVRVLVNKTRGGVLGVDPRGQVRRTVERYAGVRDIWFAPADPRAADSALLRAAPVAYAAARSPLAAALRRFALEALHPLLGPVATAIDSPPPGRSRTGGRSARRPRSRRPGTRVTSV